MNSFLKGCDNFFIKYSSILFYFLLFAIPLKLSISYLFLFPLILTGIVYFFHSPGLKQFYLSNKVISQIWLAFLAALILSGSFGVNPVRSVLSTLELCFYSLCIPIFYLIIKKENDYKFLIFLIVAQAIAGGYSFLEFLNPEKFTRLFVGTVSESGQITLTLTLSLGVAYAFLLEKQKKLFMISLFSILLITFALLVNLKRGPWAGVFVGSLCFFLIFKPRLLAVFIPMIVLPISFWEPLRDRVANIPGHFFIPGGRSDIWDLGMELAYRYPLGIGFDNSPVINEFSKIIPDNLTHFHNNYLNIWVESGMIGLILFSCFWISLFALGMKIRKLCINSKLKNKECLVFFSALCALLAWLVAGVVEYNFGDSEVMLLVYLTIAIVLVEKSRLISRS